MPQNVHFKSRRRKPMDRPQCGLPRTWAPTDLCPAQTSAPHLGPDTGCSYLGVWKGPSLKFRLVHHHKMPALPVALEPRAAEALAGLPAAPSLWGKGSWWGQQKGWCSHLQGLSYFHPPPPPLSLWPNLYSESGSTKLLLLCSLTLFSPATGPVLSAGRPGDLSLLRNPGRACSGSWRKTHQWERK